MAKTLVQYTVAVVFADGATQTIPAYAFTSMEALALVSTMLRAGGFPAVQSMHARACGGR